MSVFAIVNSGQEAVDRYGYLTAHPELANVPGGIYGQQDQSQFALYESAVQILGRKPTGGEFSTAVQAYDSGQHISYLQSIADKAAADAKAASDQAAADASTATAKSLTSSFLSGYAPYASLAASNLTPADASSIIGLEQNVQASQLSLDAMKRQVNGSVIGDTNSGSMPTAAGAANPTAAAATSSISPIYIGVALLALFFLFKKK